MRHNLLLLTLILLALSLGAGVLAHVTFPMSLGSPPVDIAEPEIASSTALTPTSTPPQEVVSLPAPIVLPATAKAGVKTQFLVTVQLPAAPPLASPVVQIMKANGKWARFGALHDDGKRGDTLVADGVFTLLKTFKPTTDAGLTLRVSARQDSHTLAVSPTVIVSAPGLFPVPTGWNVGSVDKGTVLTNTSADAIQRGGVTPLTAADLDILTLPKDAAEALLAFAEADAASLVLTGATTTSLVVAGHPAYEIIGQTSHSAPDEIRTVYVERSPTEVSLMRLRSSASAPNHDVLVSQFDYIVTHLALD